MNPCSRNGLAGRRERLPDETGGDPKYPAGVLSGDIYLSAAMHSRLLRRLAAPRGDISTPLIAGLSEREFEVLHLLGLGFGTRQIAEKLHRSIKTIETHRASLKEKLGLESATELVRFAVQRMEGE